MTDEKELLQHFLQDHTGRQNAITQKKLAKKMDMNPSTLRSELRRLREEQNIPIGNLRDGYFLIQSKEELQAFIGHVNGEIQSKKNTIEHTVEAWESFDGDLSGVERTQEVIEETYECADCGGSVPTDNAKYPKEGEYKDKPLCSGCYGRELMSR